MVKSELIQILKDKVDLSKTQAEKVVDIFFDTISDTLSKGGRVEIRGFGSFSVNSYKSYVGRNPKTGAQIKVPPKKLPFFKVGKQLKKLVDNKTGG
ncbi:MAG: integration host factor subunit beta [Desulfobacterales bacterium]|nr:MAG: integration host factor subunit beta [Desulfobacterales bacterium]